MFLVESFLGNFYRHLATFTGHTGLKQYWPQKVPNLILLKWFMLHVFKTQNRDQKHAYVNGPDAMLTFHFAQVSFAIIICCNFATIVPSWFDLGFTLKHFR